MDREQMVALVKTLKDAQQRATVAERNAEEALNWARKAQLDALQATAYITMAIDIVAFVLNKKEVE